MGLFRSASYWTVAEVVPGALLCADGSFIPILDYDGPQEHRSELSDIAMSIVEILGWRYEHRFTFGYPTTLSLEQFKSRLLEKMHSNKGLPRPIKQIEAANSYLEVMSVEFGEERSRYFNKAFEYKNWKR